MDARHAQMHDLTDDLRWDDLRILLAVSRAGSFTAAAAALEVEQSTVSRRMAALEEVVGRPLFDRLRTGPRPTESMVRIAPRLERIEAEIRALLDDVRAEETEVRGRVRLALTESMAVHVVIPHLLRELRTAHPRLEVDLLTSDFAADLGRREADLALRFFRPSDGDFVVRRVAKLRTALLAHRDYARRERALQELDVIALELPGIDTHEAAYLRRHLPVEPRMRTTGYLAQVEAVRAGLGVALLARSLRRLDPELVELDLGLPAGPTLDVYLVCPKSLRPVPRVAAVFEALERALPALERDPGEGRARPVRRGRG